MNYSSLGTVSALTYGDASAVPATAALYAVRASAPNVSDNSSPDLATTVIFTDPALVSGGTIVKSVHFTEMRIAVNAVRQLAGLAAPSYSDPAITAGLTIKAAHVTELRSALKDARLALLLPAIPYSRPALTPGSTLISSADLNELRNGTR